jgi:hypothetical protein
MVVWAGHVARMVKIKNAYKILVGKPERKSPLGRPTHRRDENTKMELREIVFEGLC